MALFLIILVIFIIYAYNVEKTIKDLRNENQMLKKKIANFNSQEERVTEKIIEKNNVEVQNTEKLQKLRQIIPDRTTILSEKKELTEEEKIAQKVKKEKQERERKNTTILITGSILIVLAAIVFLMSTWNTISNIIKTVVLVLLIGVFLGASKIAKERFNLEKASNTFFYLAMAYIPICLISCSIFGLFGSYFSIYGDGRYTYLAMSMALTAGIYFINYKIRKSDALLVGSILSQICTIILFGLIFSSSISLICILLLIYNIVLIYLTKTNSNIELVQYFYNSIPSIIGLVVILELFSGSTSLFIIFPLLIINFFVLYTKNKDSLLNAYLFNISLYAFGIFITLIYDYTFDIANSIKIIIGTLYATIVLVIEGILARDDENIIKSSMVISLTTVGIMGIKSCFGDNGFVKPYMISLVQGILMFLVYIKSKTLGKTILSYLIPCTLVFSGLDILYLLDVGYEFYIIFSLIIFIIGELFDGKDYKILNKGFLVISHINILLTYFICGIINYKEISNDVILFVLLELAYVFSFIRNRKCIVFKYFSYINIWLILLSGMNFLGLSKELNYLIPLIMTIITMLIEKNYKEINDQLSKIFISIMSVITFFALAELENLASIIIGFAFAAYLIYDNFKNEDNKYLRIIPMFGFMIVMNGAEIEKELQPIIIMLATVAATFVSVYQKKFSIDTIFSMIYLLQALDFFDNDLIKEIFFIIWSFTNMYFMQSEKSKDVFKAITYIGIYWLYKELLFEFNMDVYACCEAIGITILAMVLLKNILKKYIKSIDNLEYIVFSIIYLLALTSYTSEADGIIFVLFIVAIVMYSYMKKYGAIFIVSIIAILVNAILLTREFWLSIPWWIYLLLIGGILIGFAIKNESDDKKEKINVGNVIKNLKDKVEK